MITVCIPAYHAEDFIAETLRSVLAQTYRGFRVVVAIDPPADGPPDATRAALAPFEDDPRVEIRRNPRRLGWAENFDALVRSVDTEFYVLLPHDDIWEPNYLEDLLGILAASPGASVAYADLTYFGGGESGGRRFGVALPRGESRERHLLRFLLQGAHAMPWRGVTRTAALGEARGFPTDGYLGFAVECEYALGLLAAGEVLHEPRPLYRKRLFGGARISASKERSVAQPRPMVERAYERHRVEMRRRMVDLLDKLGVAEPMRLLCDIALEAAMQERGRMALARCPSRLESLRLRRLARRADGLHDPLAGDVVAYARWAARR